LKAMANRSEGNEERSILLLSIRLG